MLILTKNSDGLFVASEKTNDGIRAIDCAPSDREHVVNCLTRKGYPLIDIYDALYAADEGVRKAVDSRTSGMNDVLRNTKYLEHFSKKP